MSRAHSTKGFGLIERPRMIIGDAAAIAIPMYVNEREGDFSCLRPAQHSFVVLGWGSLGLGDTEYAIRVP